jgi:quinol monooxygenase YgiN
MPITIVATIKAKAGKEKELEPVLKALLIPTHHEPGCLFYALHRSEKDPRTFVFVEKWNSQAELTTHLGAVHITEAFKRKEELIESMDIAPMTLLSAGDPKKEELRV